MPNPGLTQAQIDEAKEALKEYGTQTAAADALGIHRATFQNRIRRGLEKGAFGHEDEKEKFERKETSNGIRLVYYGCKIETVEQLLEEAEVDLALWEVDRAIVNHWEVGGKIKKGDDQELWQMPLRQIKVTLRKKRDDRIAVEMLLEDIKNASGKVKKIKRPRLRKSKRRALEIDIMDSHCGLHCFPPGSDHAWSIDDCDSVSMWAVESLLTDATDFGPFEEIVYIVGNDATHADGVFHNTTKGTSQPDMMPWHYVVYRNMTLQMAIIDRLKEVAPVRVIQIPGNHDRQTSYCLGLVLWAKYDQDANVTVDASASPYKFWRYGTNLVGFDHGHSVKSNRLAALMANECRDDWQETTWREWHLGDQHRKGVTPTITFEEQGVSVEYLAALTPANEWHRINGYNWQKRGATAFVWDYHQGFKAKLSANLDSYTGQPTGIKKSRMNEMFTV